MLGQVLGCQGLWSLTLVLGCQGSWSLTLVLGCQGSWSLTLVLGCQGSWSSTLVSTHRPHRFSPWSLPPPPHACTPPSPAVPLRPPSRMATTVCGWWPCCVCSTLSVATWRSFMSCTSRMTLRKVGGGGCRWGGGGRVQVGGRGGVQGGGEGGRTAGWGGSGRVQGGGEGEGCSRGEGRGVGE